MGRCYVLCVVECQNTQVNQQHKTKFRGPLVIIEVLPNDAYRIATLTPFNKRKYVLTTAHVRLI